MLWLGNVNRPEATKFVARISHRFSTKPDVDHDTCWQIRTRHWCTVDELELQLFCWDFPKTWTKIPRASNMRTVCCSSTQRSRVCSMKMTATTKHKIWRWPYLRRWYITGRWLSRVRGLQPKAGGFHRVKWRNDAPDLGHGSRPRSSPKMDSPTKDSVAINGDMF
jgi:hypothetical protein